ncbi:YbaB/EbfC family nucleoid-associated protein [Salininema proteolyticum]|uniref:YbaB/EbfC family nucleoid-associated protein n=1 Tax=Salininema proteolyticum TaxID=1607685 RepID=A0ABV8TX73_9ACTN
MPMNQEELQGLVRRMQERAVEIEGEATAEDHSLSVRVALGGKIKGIDFNHRAFNRSGAELGEEIVKVFNRALADADRQMKEEQASLFGEDVAASAGASEPDLDAIRARLAPKGEQ